MNTLYDSKPFTTYWYYQNAKSKLCKKCGEEHVHYLLRYRIFMGLRFPIFPISTAYYLVCTHCYHKEQLGSEVDVAPVLANLENRKPVKYNKYSQLDLEGYEADHALTFGTDEELNLNIKLHMQDIWSNYNSTE